VAAEWELAGKIAVFELDLEAVPVAPPALYLDLTSFPEVREDLAVVVPQSTPAEAVLETIRQAGVPLLARAEVFDVYRDPERIGSENTSLAIRLSYRATDRTLTDQEVARQRQQIVAALEDKLGGRIRDN
jgi:phenylalanyl-tRNA synthetase beta chain